MPTMKFRTAILRLKAIDINLNYCYTSIIFSVFFILIGMNFDLHQYSSYNHCTLNMNLHSAMIIFCILVLQ